MSAITPSMSEPISIEGLDKVDLLQALWANTRAIGMGVFQDHHPRTREDFAKALEYAERPNANGIYRFDYVFGRPIKVRFDGPMLHDAWLYDRDAGEGTAQRVIDELKAKQS